MTPFTLVPKVSGALWERTGAAKLRFGGWRDLMGAAFGGSVARGRRSLAGVNVPKALR